MLLPHKNTLLVVNIATVVAACLIFLSSVFSNVEDDDRVRMLTTKFMFSERRSTNHGDSPRTQLSLCPTAGANSKFAVATYLSSSTRVQKSLKWYILSACKLGKSIGHYASSNLDLVLLLSEEPYAKVSNMDLNILEWSGWRICRVPFIESKTHQVSNRFYDAKMFSKLNVWKLVEYEAVAMVDSDVLAMQSPMPLFELVWPTMQGQGYSFGAGYDYPMAGTSRNLFQQMFGWCGPAWDKYNGGVFLLKPSHATFERLAYLMNEEGTYDPETSEQALLNYAFKNETYVLDFAYNANLVVKYCARDFYENEKAGIVFLHFTVAKPWDAAGCKSNGIEEECRLWESL